MTLYLPLLPQWFTQIIYSYSQTSMVFTLRTLAKTQMQSKLKLLIPSQLSVWRVSHIFFTFPFSNKNSVLVSTTTLGSSLGTGGMETKLIAAEIATAAGVTTIITSSKDPSCIFRIIEYDMQIRPQELRSDPCPSFTLTGPNGTNNLPMKTQNIPQPLTRPPHTLFTASLDPMPDLKSWTSHTMKPSGSVVIDAGAYHALAHRDSGGKLLAVGVIGVIGVFASEQAVRIVVPRRRQGNLEDELDAYLKGMSLMTPTTLDTATMLRELGASNVTYEGEMVDQQEAKSFLEADVIEVGRGLTNYNSAQIVAVKGLNRWVTSFWI